VSGVKEEEGHRGGEPGREKKVINERRFMDAAVVKNDWL